MQTEALVEKELKQVLKELDLEKDDNRKRKLKGAKKALEWVLDPMRHFNPHDL